MTRTLLAILAAAVAAIVAFNVLIRQYGDPARDAIERETTATKPKRTSDAGTPSLRVMIPA